MELYCIGDSLTSGYGVSRRKCWTTITAEKSGMTVHNLGISGDTTGGMLVRTVTQVIPYCDKYNSCVLVMGGHNDIFCTGNDSSAKANKFRLSSRVGKASGVLCRKRADFSL